MDSEIIDIHIHFGAPEDGLNGCYWSKEFTKTAAYYAMLLITHSLFKKITFARVQEQLLSVIENAELVAKSVLLAMDQVYDETGKALPQQTHLYTPNHVIARLAQGHERILFGASIHPYRKEWQAELDFCLQNKAVLCKWIPSSQMIDPSHSLCLPFYKKLAEYHLPLLCHAGPEYAIPTAKSNYNEFNNPKYLRQALDLGVTVILAHCGLPYFADLDRPYLDDYLEFLNLFDESARRGWKLYADLSAVTGPLRKKYIPEIKKRVPASRLIFGSDYPIPISEFSYHGRMNPGTWFKFMKELFSTKNPLDKNYKILAEMEFESTVFANAGRLFEEIRYAG
jgi:uncharacterized protein